jgi:hypothetical protein
MEASTQTSCGTPMEASIQTSCGTSMEGSTKTMLITSAPSANQTKSRDDSGRIIHFRKMVQTIHEELHHGDVHKVHAEIKNKGVIKRRLLRSICSVIRSCSCDVSTQLQQQKIDSTHTSSKLSAKLNSSHVKRSRPTVKDFNSQCGSIVFNRSQQMKTNCKTDASRKLSAKPNNGHVNTSKPLIKDFKRQCRYKQMDSRKVLCACSPRSSICTACHHSVCHSFGGSTYQSCPLQYRGRYCDGSIGRNVTCTLNIIVHITNNVYSCCYIKG